MRTRLGFFVLVVLLLTMSVPLGASARMHLADAPLALKIAVAGPFSVGAIPYAQGMDRGAQLAVSDYAAELASAGVSISVVDADDRGDVASATAIASAIVADTSTVGVVGHLNSACSIAASAVYDGAHLAMISPLSTNPALTQAGHNNVFRVCGTDPLQGPAAADAVAKNLRIKSAYVVDDSSVYGRTQLAANFAKRFKADGGKILGTAHTTGSQTDFTSLVKKIKAKNPGLVYYGGLYPSGARLAKQLRQKKVAGVFEGGDGLFDQGFVSIAGKSRAEGTLATTVGLATEELPGGVDYVSRAATAFPGKPVLDTDDPYAYDAAVAIIRAILRTAEDSGTAALSSPDARELIRARVAASDFSGVTGRVAFTAAGDTQAPALGVWRVRAGSWKPCAIVGVPQFTGTITHGVAFVVTGSLSPRHPSGSNAVVLKFYRKKGGKWVLGKSVKASTADSGAFSAYSANVKLAPKGAWRVYAEHSDVAHPLMDSPTRAFAVK